MLKSACLILLATVTVAASAAERPNVVLFMADDVSWNDYGCYGNTAARTPNIDALAANGIRFDRAYLTASSCSPSRSSIITGRYPHNNGKAAELHKPISGHLPWFPETLRDAGYYTALSGKHHMKSTTKRPVPFDHVDGGKNKNNSGGHANWVKVTEERPKDKPFFFWFAAYDAHRGWDSDKQWDTDRYGPMHKPQDVIVPPFLSDDAATRDDLASYYNEVTRFDYYIGQVVAELKQQRVLDNTLIFVMADNGRPFPRAKTRLHDSGMKTALVAHWPAGIQHTGPSVSLVSVIDLAPTILKVAGCDVPETMQGVSMQPLFDDSSAGIRQYAFSEHNWHDYEAHGRSVRHGDYMLLKNFRTQLPLQGPADSVRSPSHEKLLALKEAGQLSAAQQDVFLAPRPEVELYNVVADPHQLNNLAGNPAHQKQQSELAAVLEQWMDETGDSVPEKISPDTFHRVTGKPLPKDERDETGAITPGQDRNADQINAAGPR
ncbi:sulfatase family protein [Fuerstiella marisgermanici]|uniref:Arylsulfatase n=1 Tax=Fuerstiella marisgermanici TaxID=1891926 RepID=A0A1P8WQL6_9PLAN|nr:sulfatase [Fuerstiella marisgermanici]APZ96348.1 Arylsulfatase [Fuerstiella marisgermanici]